MGREPFKQSEKATQCFHGRKETQASATSYYLKKSARASYQITSAIKLWIQMLVPKMEDGNNFGVEVGTRFRGN